MNFMSTASDNLSHFPKSEFTEEHIKTLTDDFKIYTFWDLVQVLFHDKPVVAFITHYYSNLVQNNEKALAL
jgi:hypothetical protein